MKDKIKNAASLEELQALYSETFGKNGTMTAKLKNMANLPFYVIVCVLLISVILGLDPRIQTTRVTLL